MGVDVVTGIVIDRARPVVSAYAADPNNAPHWYVNIVGVEWRSSPPLAIGSRLAFVARFLGRRLEYTYVVKAFVPEQSLVMATAVGPFPMETSYTWTDEPGGRTRMSLRNRGKPAGFSRVLAPLVAMAMRRANRADLKRLKALLEAMPVDARERGQRRNGAKATAL